MGHNSDKLYVTHSEHASGSHTAGSSGHLGKPKTVEFQRLPFDCCALSLTAFDVPVAVIREDGKEADCFELTNIIPYMKKFGTNPVTSLPLKASQLLPLQFHRNSTTNAIMDPVSFKPFTPHTHIVFLRPTGNVYSYETIQRLCLKPKSLRDLIDDTPFERSDIVTLQDPHNLSGRELATFDYVKMGKEVSKDEMKDPLKGINVAGSALGSTAKILKELALKSASTATPTPLEEEGKEIATVSKKEGIVAAKPKAARQSHLASGTSTGYTAASFTSTSMDVSTKTEQALFDEEEFMFDEIVTAAERDKGKTAKGVKSKGYCRIVTNLGAMSIELHCDKAPKTCYNFLMLARENKYDDNIFHRNIPGFMIQGGDPTGTGKGGSSYWGLPFRDEFDMKGAERFTERGVLGMANHGTATNGSQFFITFRATPHLNTKHTAFGKLVGGEEVLNALESVPSEKGTDRPLRELKILKVEIFQDPFEEWKVKLAKRLAREERNAGLQLEKEDKKLEREKDRVNWFGDKLGEKGVAEKKRKTGAIEDQIAGGVGKYVAGSTPSPAQLPAATGYYGEADGGKKKRKTGGGFGDFGSW